MSKHQVLDLVEFGISCMKPDLAIQCQGFYLDGTGCMSFMWEIASFFLVTAIELLALRKGE